MPNTKSAKKAVRSSARKRKYNTIWKKRIKDVVRAIKTQLETKNPDVDILNKELSVLQKTVDKAAKNNVIHKNKANRLKSRYAQRITAQAEGKTKKASSKKEAGTEAGK